MSTSLNSDNHDRNRNINQRSKRYTEMKLFNHDYDVLFKDESIKELLHKRSISGWELISVIEKEAYTHFFWKKQVTV